MRETLKNTKAFLIFSLLILFTFSSCDNFSFGANLRDQIEDDLGVTYSFYEEPDEKATRVTKKFITGKRIDKNAFPKFEREEDMVAGWLYLKNYNKPDSKLPENFRTNRKNYISEIQVTNSSESFYAVWKKKCVVTFVTNCDITLEPLTTPQGEFIEWPEIEHKHNGLLLWGWYKDSEFTQPFGYDDIVMSDITLYAQWVEYRTITYYKNDGSDRKNEYDYRLNYEANIEDCMFGERNGYGFVGWSTSPGANRLEDVNYHHGQKINQITENLNLYAVWSQDVVTITYIDSSGNFPSRTARYGRGAYITVGRVLDERENWFRYLYDIWKLEGKELAGFSTTPDASSPYQFNSGGYYTSGNYDYGYDSNAYQVNSDMTFYGHVDDIVFHVYFYTLNASGQYYMLSGLTQTVGWNQCATMPSDPAVVPHHTFTHWSQGQWNNGTPMIYSSPFDFSMPFNDDTMNRSRGINIFAVFGNYGNSNGTIDGTISFEEDPLSDIVVTKTINSPNITLTINTTNVNTSTISWTFDYAEKTDWAGNTSHTFDTSTLSNGYHDILITAQKTDGNYYSYHLQLNVNH